MACFDYSERLEGRPPPKIKRPLRERDRRFESLLPPAESHVATCQESGAQRRPNADPLAVPCRKAKVSAEKAVERGGPFPKSATSRDDGRVACSIGRRIRRGVSKPSGSIAQFASR